ncbi:MFS transporter [Limimaricola litoreus]
MAGFGATAVTYGPARMGFGLFLPQFREAFGLGSGMAGLIAGGAFLAYLLTVLAAGPLTARHGARVPVLIGAALACTGMGLVAAAPSLPVLAAGVLIAGGSAGLAWTPFNNAAARHVDEAARPRALSIVSTGTTFGVAAAGALAFVAVATAFGWRLVWGLFAVAGLGMGIASAIWLRGATRGGGDGEPLGAWRSLLRRDILPLALAAFSFGLGAAVWFSFAVDAAARAGADLGGGTTGPLMFLAYGLGGGLGLATGWLVERCGIAWLIRVIFAAGVASALLIALIPQAALAALGSAMLQGAGVMTISALLSFWSAKLFPELPSLSFTAVLLAMALGGALGPMLAGSVLDAIGSRGVFLGTAALLTATGLWLGPRHVPSEGRGEEAVET